MCNFVCCDTVQKLLDIKKDVKITFGSRSSSLAPSRGQLQTVETS